MKRVVSDCWCASSWRAISASTEPVIGFACALRATSACANSAGTRKLICWPSRPVDADDAPLVVEHRAAAHARVQRSREQDLRQEAALDEPVVRALDHGEAD